MIRRVMVALLLAALCRAQNPRDVVDPDYHHAPEAALEQWRDWKFGLRIHWSLYSMYGGRESWPLLKYSEAEKMRYWDSYKVFNPVHFNADQWMDLIQRSGMKFFTFTTRHHDGFSMWDTRTVVTQRVDYTAAGGPQLIPFGGHFSIMEAPFRRDIVRELTAAAHQRGVGVGLYYSNPDWFDADFRMEWDKYAGLALGDRNLKTKDPQAYNRYIQRYREQVRELLSNYGKVDLLSLDMDTPDDAWPDIRETVKMARKLQPGVMMRDRGIGAYGDYTTPENSIPKGPDDLARIARAYRTDPRLQRPWMVIHALGGVFSFEPDGNKYRSGEWIVSTLIDVVSKGGMFEVGIGPDGNGLFHPIAIRQLEYAGDWLKVNGEAIYKTRPWKQSAEGDDVRFTASKDQSVVYAIVLRWPGERLQLNSVQPRPGASIEMLGVPGKLKWQLNTAGGVAIDLPSALQDPARRPSPLAWAFRIPVR